MQKEEKKNKGIGYIIKTIFLGLAIIVLLIAGSILIKANKNPDTVPDIFGYKPMIVLSGSMETSIDKGDLVFIKIVDPTILEVDDIIAFRNEANTVTTHRIVEVVTENGNTLYRTKGDANNTEDLNLVAEEDIEGIYVWKMVGVGSFLLFMKEPIGLAVVLLVILVIGLLWLYLINIQEEKKYKKNVKLQKEFEEFKKMKEQQSIKQDE